MTNQTVYLISQYPALSHTFILREITEMTELGWDVKIASINKPDRPIEAMLPEEQAHAKQALFVKRQGFVGVLYALLSLSFRKPLGVLNGFLTALKLSEGEPGALLYQLFYYAEALILAEWMRQQKVHHVHVHFANMAASVGLLCKKITGCNFTIMVHGPDELLNHRMFRLTEKFQCADLLLCITDFARSQVCLYLPPEQWHKAQVVRVGLYPQEFLNLAKQRSDALQDPHIVTIGRLSPAKGQHILIDAVARLKRTIPNVRLTVIGTGPLKDSLTSHMQSLGLTENVRLVGGLNQDEVQKILITADVFALSSFAEGLPVVLMEALLAGIPCVTTTIAGIPELIRHELDGLLVPAGNPEKLAEALQMSLENPNAARAMAASGRERVLAMHDIRQNARQIAGHFARLQTGSVQSQVPINLKQTASATSPTI